MTTLLLVLSLTMLVRIAWSGVVFDQPIPRRPDEPAAKGTAESKRA